MVDEANEKEARAVDTINQLKLEIANLSKLVEQGAGLSLGQDSRYGYICWASCCVMSTRLGATMLCDAYHTGCYVNTMLCDPHLSTQPWCSTEHLV